MEATKNKEDPYSVVRNWRALIEKEELSARQWNRKWGFLLPLFAERYKGSRRLLDVERNIRRLIAPNDQRSVKPFPQTTSQEVGWISVRPEFTLEMYGPYCLRIPLEPPSNFDDEE
ncbi:hypothetical protein J437_LFUL004751 [Ladona fulva]|uniref:Uncharacterized protein n=1 Tax=Ladona fulva TaxID=123851 RepID=A0A8K0P410_LADFU|nr:hypothetical protein J437_LFUL004751 [Ladona fulva]